MPTILFDARLVLEKPTGIGQYVCALLPEMLRQAPAWRFHLLRRPAPWPGYGMAEWRAPNLVQHVTREPHMSLRQHVSLPRLARRLGADLLHYPHFDAPVLYQTAPVVVTLHDAKYLERPDFFTSLGAAKRAYMRFSFAQSLRRAAAVIVVSRQTAAALTALFGTPAARLNVVYEAADAQFRPADAAAVAAFRGTYGVERPFVLSVGERRPHKNHLGLLRAYAASAARHSHDLVIIGQPHAGYEAPEAFAREAGLAGQVHFLSRVSADELVAAYTAAELFVLVSFYEGFGLPLLEAMACDTPVLAASTTATAEIVADAGVLVDPADETAVGRALDALLADPARRAALVARGRARRAAFTWQRAAAETLGVYRGVLGAADKSG